MILDGTLMTVDVRSPTFDNLIAEALTVTIRPDAVEIGNVEDTEIDTSVVGAEFDVTGSEVAYRIITSGGRFTNVNDDTGFNGYRLQFQALAEGRISLRDVDLIEAENTLGIAPGRIAFTRDTVTMNVDGLSFSFDETVVLELGFRIQGNNRGNTLLGENGRDQLLGRDGDDVLSGGGNDDELVGGDGNDSLDGGDGVDTLDGGKGRDSLTGGAGADSFVLRAGGGIDAVADFEIGVDLIRIGTGASEFGQLSIRDTEGGVRISDAKGALILAGVLAEDVAADWFVF